MRKYLIAALVLAAGCDATRRDYSVCDSKYRSCRDGFTCNLTTERCEPITDASPPVEAGLPDAPPIDVATGEVAVTDAADAPATDVTLGEVQPVDVPTPDAPIERDGPPLDSRVPDAAGTCSRDLDCAGSARPYCVNNQCVACRTSNHCSNTVGTPFCSALNTCVSCAAATGDGGICPGNAPICDRGSGRCVECTRNGECPTAAEAFCVANQCVGCNAPGASAGSGGGTDGGIRDGGGVEAGAPDGGVVGPCTGSKPVCATSGTLIGQCVQCVSSADCSGGTPICNSANLCTACTSDSQCASLGTGPGVCMSHQDGRCASATETIYVQNAAPCSSSGPGTATSPFCDSQAGLGAVTTSRRVIVLKGPATAVLTPVSSTSTTSSGQVSFIGQNGATTSAGAAIAIHVTAGDIYVRGLTVAGGTSSTAAAIQVEAGAILRLNRCVIKNNVGGGIIMQPGANFDIANCVFDNNGPRTVGTVRFGGAHLAGSPSSSGPSTFRFSTVVNNQETGVVCADNTQNLFGMIMLDNVGGAFLNCDLKLKTEGVPPNERVLGADSKWDSPGRGSDISDPRFSTTNPYHLTASSPCREFIAASSLALPIDDMDGDVRPYPSNGKFDCGADEYRP